jgi:hypothetical protein
MPNVSGFRCLGLGEASTHRRKEKNAKFLAEGNLRFSQPFQTFFVGFYFTNVSE